MKSVASQRLGKALQRLLMRTLKKAQLRQMLSTLTRVLAASFPSDQEDPIPIRLLVSMTTLHTFIWFKTTTSTNNKYKIIIACVGQSK